jgi:molybdopterin converting factor small subunit
MTIPITIPTPLRGYAGGQKTIAVEGGTVGEALSSLTTQYPSLRQHLFAEDGQLRSFVNVYLNDEDVRYLKHVNTPLAESDKLSIVPSVAGG